VPEYSPRFGFASDLAERLGNKLDEPVILRHDGRREPGGLWIGFMAGGERWWLVLPPPRFKAPSCRTICGCGWRRRWRP
jgi:two-component system osmolarity sensor histidine kinase EnvZ